MRQLLTILAAFFFPFFAWAQKGSDNMKPLAVIAYYSGNATDVYKYEIEKLTHIIYSFLVLKGNKLKVSPQAAIILKNLVGLKKGILH